MNRVFLIILFFVYSFSVFCQNNAYDVDQTQVSRDLKVFKPLSTNPIFTGFVIKSDGIECYMPEGKYSFIENDLIYKKPSEDRSYELNLSIDDNLQVALFFTPYPQSTSESKLLFAMVTMGGLVKSDPNLITFFRLVFHKELVMDLD